MSNFTREAFEAQAELDMQQKSGLTADEVKAGKAGQSMQDFYSDWYDSTPDHTCDKETWISRQMSQNAFDHNVSEETYGAVADKLVQRAFGKDYGCKTFTTEDEYNEALSSGETAQADIASKNVANVYEMLTGAKSPLDVMTTLVEANIKDKFDSVLEAAQKGVDELGKQDEKQAGLEAGPSLSDDYSLV